MSAVPDRKTLEGMKRVDLQRLCKDHGLRANLKSESLIDLLLEATKPAASSQPSRPTRSSSMRIISKSSSGSRPRGHSSSSVIIHDTDEEEALDDAPEDTGTASQPEPEPPLVAVPARTIRKAKESQYKLGVGRPTIAGGSGARAVTRTGSVSKPKRGKAPSRSVKPSEVAIQEVDEELDSVPPVLFEPTAGPSGTVHNEFLPKPPSPPRQSEPPTQEAPITLNSLKSTIAEMILPMQDQMQALHANFDEVARNTAETSSLRAQVATLTSEVSTLRIEVSRNARLEAEVNMLKDHIAALREMSSLNSSHTRTESAETTDKAFATDPRVSEPGPRAQTSEPSVATVMLGKRQRSPNDSNLTGVIEAKQEYEDLAGEDLQPSKKRAKLAQDSIASGSSSSKASAPPAPGLDGDDTAAGPPSTSPGLGFTIYNGPEVMEDEFDPPPPTTHLSELFAHPNPSSNLEVGSRTGNVDENIQEFGRDSAFNFTFPDSVFQPITSTPIATFDMGPRANSTSIPFPEPPTSPTPGPSPERGGGRRDRNDRLQFGTPMRSPIRPHIGAGRLPSLPQPAASTSTHQLPNPEQPPQFISPAALMRTTPPPSAPEPSPGNNQATLGIGMGRPSSSGVSRGPGVVALPLPMPPDTPAPPMKRTMYGTELDADSRFGDFGMDGVAMGFWTGVAPRF